MTSAMTSMMTSDAARRHRGLVTRALKVEFARFQFSVDHLSLGQRILNAGRYDVATVL